MESFCNLEIFCIFFFSLEALIILQGVHQEMLHSDLGPKGRGKLRQTNISGFLTSTRGRREGNSTVGEETLLGDRTTTTVGQESRAVVRCSMAGIKRNVGDC